MHLAQPTKVANDTTDFIEKLMEGLLDGEFEEDAIVGTSFSMSTNHICQDD
jgi:hypothetical protein